MNSDPPNVISTPNVIEPPISASGVTTQQSQEGSANPFKATEITYTQWCEDFRALQTVFWQVPFFSMTITGGIVAAVLAFDGAVETKRLLLIFGGICNIALILIAWRVRKIMEVLLIKILSFEGIKKPKTEFFVLKCFSGLFFFVALALGCAGALFPTQWLSNHGNSIEQENTGDHSDASPTIIINN